MKLRHFQHYLQEKKIGLALLVHPDPSITYFTQMKPSYAYLAITPKSADFYLTKLDSHPAIPSMRTRTLQKGWEKRYKRIRKIGINKELLTVSRLEKIKNIWPKANIVDIGTILKELRSQKMPAEIRKISTACDITCNALQALVKELPGKKLQTEQDVALFLERKIKEQGAELAFSTIVAMGRNAATPHHVTSAQQLRRGFLLLDFGACYQYYCADMTRVLFLGKPTAKEKAFYQLLLQAQQHAVNQVRHGRSFTELDKAARKHLGKYSSHFIHSLGHGIGIEVHEAPSFLKEEKIQHNCVFTLEPGIYFPGKFGLRIEDTLVFDGETRILTTFPKELMLIPF